MNYIIEIIFLAVNSIFALIQINMRKIDIAHGKTDGINHSAWLALYGVLMLIVWFVFAKSWVLMICLSLMRIWFFNPLFNLLAGNPFFHLGKKSVIDRLITPIYKPFYFICLIGFIILQFFL